ncbi:MAG: HNH endonuclease [Desulfurellaceae bacterium]|nr:HNH endonuclease [Desulfurellaceae bacterium]
MGTFLAGLKRHLSIYSHEGNAFDLAPDTMIKKKPTKRCWHKIVKRDRIALSKEAVYRLAPAIAPKDWAMAAKDVDRSVGSPTGDYRVETYASQLYKKNKDKVDYVIANIGTIERFLSDLETGIDEAGVKSSTKKSTPRTTKTSTTRRRRNAGQTSKNQPQRNDFPDEIGENASLPEGAKQRVTVNKYERNPRARQQCIDHYGKKCCICGFSFEATYGEVAKKFIHVHHVRPLSEIGKRYTVDPVEDLRPVCPNCHAVIHRKGEPAFSIEEVKAFLQRAEPR